MSILILILSIRVGPKGNKLGWACHQKECKNRCKYAVPIVMTNKMITEKTKNSDKIKKTIKTIVFLPVTLFSPVPLWALTDNDIWPLKPGVIEKNVKK